MYVYYSTVYVETHILQDYEEDVDSGAYRCCVTTYTGRTKFGAARYLNVTSVRDARTGLFVFLLPPY